MSEDWQAALKDMAEVVVTAVVLAFLIMTFIARSYVVPSSSMEPTLLVGDRVLVDKVSYHFIQPKRGEIVVFKVPGRKGGPPYIKRLIGLPGDTIRITGGKLVLNGKTIEEGYIKEPMLGEWGPYVVPAGSYFFMGDNRNNSQDSRYIGYVPKANLIGRALVRYWPLNRLAVVIRPEVLR